MDDAEADFTSHMISPNPDHLPLDLDGLLRGSSTCAHTRTCNPPGPNAATHSRVLPAGEREKGGCQAESRGSRRHLGNREAVRRYRQKKKAHAAHLEDQVKNLRLVNHQLLRRLQGQEELEAEVARLRALLSGIRAKIDGELGSFPFQNRCSGAGRRRGSWEPNKVVERRIARNDDVDQHAEIEGTSSTDRG